MNAIRTRAVLYAATTDPRRPDLVLAVLRGFAEHAGWTVAESRWDQVFDPWHLGKVPDGWTAAREAALEGRADVLLVGRLHDVAPFADSKTALAAWAADHTVPVIAMDAGELGRWYRMGPDPARLPALRRTGPVPSAPACCGPLVGAGGARRVG